MTWTVDFYEEDDGSAPVEKFLAQLPKEHRAKAVAIIKRLEEAGPTLPFPYSSHVRGKIRELRIQQGRDKIRILYFADKRRRFILLHGLIKGTQKLSKSNIETAEQRMNQHNRRLERR
ncbi:MAG: type II toxin-antitoxin system RelE/ParE family toxin [Acidobacteria bacterium]|nr:type II toxin-antitoxin system RelE/ParE family toxin [Acidobacteriota bacterium]